MIRFLLINISVIFLVGCKTLNIEHGKCNCKKHVKNLEYIESQDDFYFYTLEKPITRTENTIQDSLINFVHINKHVNMIIRCTPIELQYPPTINFSYRITKKDKELYHKWIKENCLDIYNRKYQKPDNIKDTINRKHRFLIWLMPIQRVQNMILNQEEKPKI
jgi:hypothetical protein